MVTTEETEPAGSQADRPDSTDPDRDQLVPLLREQGFDPVDTDLPGGGWVTDGDWTLVIDSKHTPTRDPSKFNHVVRVYQCAPSEIGVDIPLAARAVDTSHELALRRALDNADYPLEATA